jgi:hypothetical protein
MRKKAALWTTLALLGVLVLFCISYRPTHPPKARLQRAGGVNTVRSVSMTLTALLSAEEAKTMAMRLANGKASTVYHCQPFRDGQPSRFAAGQWVWVGQQGFGRGDIQATVELATDGSTNSVDLKLLDSQYPLP